MLRSATLAGEITVPTGAGRDLGGGAAGMMKSPTQGQHEVDM